MNESRFTALWENCGGRGAAGVFHRLIGCYSEPHRAYHNAAHIADCLERLDGTAAGTSALELAIWFHDVIYDPRAKDNEEQSGMWFLREADSGSLSGTLISEVRRLILVTAHHRAEREDEALLCDIDLSILGSGAHIYDRYAAGIRSEYAWVTESDWRAGRGAVLRSFLSRTAVFRTPHFSGLEAAARSNLERELRSLTD